MGTAALGCPVEQGSTRFLSRARIAEGCSAGQPRAAVPPLSMVAPEAHELGSRAYIASGKRSRNTPLFSSRLPGFMFMNNKGVWRAFLGLRDGVGAMTSLFLCKSLHI